MTKTTPRILISVIGALALITTPVFAQQTTAGTEADNDDMITLSPFTVSGEDAQGYQAQNTLSGTRLKTSLEDVGASISVMTAELLSDIGATDITDAFLYSTNTENEKEFQANDTEGIADTTTNQNRVRGLTASNYSRGFFDTNVRADMYNTERFTLSYGPNSILYGMGSPAGIADATPKQARTNRFSGEVSSRFDTNDSARVSLDLNAPLIKNMLGLRIAAMDQKKKGWRIPDIDDERRLFGTLTFTPFKNTVIRYSFEDMENSRSTSRANLPYDGISQWLDNGKPLYDQFSNRLTYDNGATWVNAPRVGNTATVDQKALYALGIQFQGQPNARVQMYGANVPDSGTWSAIADPAQRALFAQSELQALRWFNSPNSTGRSSSADPLYTMSDDSLLPYDYNIAGLSRTANFKSKTNTIFLEQRLTQNWYLELAYNRENWHRQAFDPLRSTGEELQADVSYYLPLYAFPNAATGSIQANLAQIANTPANSTPVALIKNPNAGRLYVDGQGIGYDQRFIFDTYRATMSYELDLTRRNEWLGKHSFAALYQRDDKQELYFKSRHVNQPGYNLGNVQDNTTDNIIHRYYIDPPGNLGTNGATGPVYPGYFTEVDTDFWKTRVWAVTPAQPMINSLRELEGKMIVWQARLLKNRLTTTVGLREDSEKLYQSFNTNDSVGENGVRGYLPVPGTPTYTPVSGTTKTFGAVYKATDKISVFYNQSNSFLPQSFLRNYFDEPLEPAVGDGKDIGVMLNLMDGKLFARASWYEQSATGAVELDWTYEIMKWRLVNSVETAIRRWETIIPQRQAWADAKGLSTTDGINLAIDDSIRSTRDFKSSGIELELNARPVKGLDLRLTVAKNESINTRTLPEFQQFVEARMPVWSKYEGLAIRPDLSSRVPAPSDPTRDTVYGTTRGQLLTNNNTIGWLMYVQPEGLQRLAFAKEEEGTASARNRKYRANFIANYKFQEGRLKGLGVGVGVRYRSKGAIGYQGKPNEFIVDLLASEPGVVIAPPTAHPNIGLQQADITKPIYGEATYDFDAWVKYERRFTLAGKPYTWLVQLNVTNLFNDDDIVPFKADFNNVIEQWTTRAPRGFALTNTFKF